MPALVEVACSGLFPQISLVQACSHGGPQYRPDVVEVTFSGLFLWICGCLCLGPDPMEVSGSALGPQRSMAWPCSLGGSSLIPTPGLVEGTGSGLLQ